MDTRRCIQAGCAAVFGLAVLSFGIAVLLPVYTDELAWKLQQSRMHLDALRALGLFPTCGNLSVAIPTVLLPFRLVDALLYEHLSAPFQLRLGGAVTGLLGVIATVLAVRRLRIVGTAASLALVVSFATLGIMPFLLVINRPDQVLAIAIVLLSLPLLFGAEPAPRSRLLDVLYGGLLCFACAFVLSEHPRGLFALPLMLLFVARFIGRKPVATAVCAALVAVAAVSLRHWTARAACSDPALEKVLVFDNITFAAAHGQLPLYFWAQWQSWLTDPYQFLFIAQFQLKQHYGSYFVPDGESGMLAELARRLGTRAFLGLLLAGAFAFVVAAARSVRDRRSRLQVLALAALWAFWAASAIGRVQKNEYEAAVMMPVIALAATGSLWAARAELARWFGAARWRLLCRAAFAGLIGLSLVNQAALLRTYAPKAFGAWLRPGYAQEQRFSVSLFGYDRLRPRIVKTGALCGIDPADRPRRLIVDELTYYAYVRASEPVLATYLDARGWGYAITDYRRLLSKIGSRGMVTGCQWIPTELRADAKRNGDFCCLPAFAGG